MATKLEMYPLAESYPLSPLQQGMLFYSLHTPKVGVDVEQIVIDFHESLNVPRFQQAWQALIRRHAVLSTVFRWDAHPPLQDVYHDVVFPWLIEDWRLFSPSEQAERFTLYLQNDRQAGFNLADIPLVRFALLRVASAEYKFVWTFHHILMDGRSHLLLLKELFALYEQPASSPLLSASHLPLPRPYRLHVEWLAEQDLSRGQQFWQTLLQGFTTPTPLLNAPLSLNLPHEATVGRGELEIALSSDETAALAALAQAHQLTLNTLVQGAWALLLSRYSHEEASDVVFGAVRACRHSSVEGAEAMIGLFINTLPVRAQFTPDMPLLSFLKALRAQSIAVREHEHTPLVDVQAWSDVGGGKPLFESILVFDHYLLNTALQDEQQPQRREVYLIDQTAYPLTLYAYGGKELLLKLSYERERFDEALIRQLLQHLKQLFFGMAANPDCTVGSLSLLTDAERQLLLIDWNQTATPYPQDATIHEIFELQVSLTPDAVAVVFEDQALTYRQLDQRANQLAHHLQALGVTPDTPVGIYMNRSLEMMVGLFGILKAGGAYLPLDPTYPAERITFMLEDAQVPILLTQAQLAPQLPAHHANVVRVDADWGTIGKHSVDALATDVTSDNLAYLIYTSGSTGKPKGVMIEHRNVVNFFAGMDQRIPLSGQSPPVWLAVTSLSFDISVLELFWTLARGFKVVLYDDQYRYAPASPYVSQKIEFSLFYFSSDESEDGVTNKYRLLLEGAKFADQHGFKAIWTPERHFHAFGGLYPNPAVVSAAIAGITKQIHICAGSTVLPLHSPIRVAEEWAVVDNLSNGRVGLGVAAGWQPNDFVLMPQNYADRKAIMFRDIEVLRRLWRGETVSLPGPAPSPTNVGGGGREVAVSTLPRPIQKELPIWITIAGNPESYRMAGEGGYYVLTHLLGQSIEELAEKLTIYREAWQASGAVGRGHVTLMLHSFVGDDVLEVRELVRQPMINYLTSAVSLVQKAGWYFPTVKEADKLSDEMVELSAKEQLSGEDVAAVLDYAFERYFETSGLFGTPTSCLPIVDKLKAAGVDEIGCLIDFGVPSEMVLEHLEQLNQLRELASAKPIHQDHTIAALIKRHGVTHFQCVPSMATILLADDETRESLSAIKTFLVGGEPLPLTLAQQLKKAVSGKVINMYGPTETTIWSTTNPVENTPEAISIGRPIANTQIYIVERNRPSVLAPIGVAGELLIGGDGVVRGYLNRAQLTAERFIKNPFGAGRLYRTGDLARFRADGQIEFLGRMDHQVKIRGYRIELGEIETRLEEHPHIRQAVVMAAALPLVEGVRGQGEGGQELVAYLIASSPDNVPSGSELQAVLAQKLPDFMIPSHFITLEAFPLTPNKKIDRQALPAPTGTKGQIGQLASGREVVTGKHSKGQAVAYAPPTNAIEETIAQIWQELLHLPQVGRHDNFFDLGGHSLLAVQAHRRLREVIPNQAKISVMELFRYPTIRALSEHLSRQMEADQSPISEPTSNERIKARREAMKTRQRRRK